MVKPVLSLDWAREDLRIEHNNLDTLLARTNDWVTAKVERDAQITLRPAVTRKLSLPAFPNYNGDGFTTRRGWPEELYRVAPNIQLGFPPVNNVLSVTYYDVDNVEQTVASSNYRFIQVDRAPSSLEFDHDYSFPTTYDRLDAVNITFLTGSSDPDEVGLIAATLYREWYIDRSPLLLDEYRHLINSLKVHSFGLTGVTRELGLPGIDVEATTAHFREETYAINRADSLLDVAPSYAEISAWQNPHDANAKTYASATLPIITGANCFIYLADQTLEQWELTSLSPETWTKVGVTVGAGGGGGGGEDLQQTNVIGNQTSLSMEYLTTAVGTIFVDGAGNRWIEGTTELGESIRIKLA